MTHLHLIKEMELVQLLASTSARRLCAGQPQKN
jgi:hypothetical protein